jgi:hypothetical protein
MIRRAQNPLEIIAHRISIEAVGPIPHEIGGRVCAYLPLLLGWLQSRPFRDAWIMIWSAPRLAQQRALSLLARPMETLWPVPLLAGQPVPCVMTWASAGNTKQNMKNSKPALGDQCGLLRAYAWGIHKMKRDSDV